MHGTHTGRGARRSSRRSRAVLAIASCLLATAVAPLAAPRVVDGSDQEPGGSTRFTTVDVVVDAGSALLAAWQVELVDRSGRTRIVGVEGGEPGVYAEPATYDPAALAGGRIVLAAFDTRGPWPTGRIRVARLHLAVEGAADPDLDVRIPMAVGPGCGALEVTVHTEH